VGPEGCDARFEQLLALDHSRQEPWGPLHGLAFACFALQHPSQHITSTLERAWLMLHRIVVAGDKPSDVARGLRRAHGSDASWQGAPFPGREAHPARFDVTITDLGDFPAERYAADAARWARATLVGYGLDATETKANAEANAEAARA
jgi:hypothetical protein